jgi:acylphosphatase
MKRIRLIVTGVVQGVGFRYYTHKEARSLSITGFVRNLPDGSVDIEAQGTEDKIARLIEWAKHGPRNAFVESCRIDDVQVVDDDSDFEIR